MYFWSDTPVVEAEVSNTPGVILTTQIPLTAQAGMLQPQ